jgi:hypothetical protein
MTEVYAGDELPGMKKRRRTYIVTGAAALAAAAVFCTLVTVFLRWEHYALAMFLNIAVTFLTFSGMLFINGTKYRYVNLYYKALRHLSTGLKVTQKGLFLRVEDAPTVKDGVEYRVIIMQEDTVKRPDLPERRVLLDGFKEMPDFSENEALKYITCGSVLLAYERI